MKLNLRFTIQERQRKHPGTQDQRRNSVQHYAVGNADDRDDWDSGNSAIYYRMDEEDNEFDLDPGNSDNAVPDEYWESDGDTDSNTSSDHYDDAAAAAAGSEAAPSEEHTEKLYAVYSKAKKALRRHVAKPTRKFRRGLRRNFGKRFRPKNQRSKP